MSHYNLLKTSQHGFSAQTLTTAALIDEIKVINITVLNKEYCLEIFMNFSKAFDCIDRNLLLTKLEAYGIRRITLDWFTSYSHLRQQY